MTLRPLKRTTYRDPASPHNVRAGNTTRAESVLDFESYSEPLMEAFAALRGSGIATGLNVTAIMNAPDITVAPGLAIDAQGRVMIVAPGGHVENGANADAPGVPPHLLPVTEAGVTLPTAGLTGSQALVIQWWETFDQAGFDDDGAERIEHTPWLQWVPFTPTVNLNDRTLLAFVAFGKDADTGKVTSILGLRNPLLQLGNSVEFRGLLGTFDDKTGVAADSVVAKLTGIGGNGGLSIEVPDSTGKKATLKIENSNGVVRLDTSRISIPAISDGITVVNQKNTGEGWFVNTDDITMLLRGPTTGPSISQMVFKPGMIHSEAPALTIENVGGPVKINSDLQVTGRASFTGPKVGFVVDEFRNCSDRPLELGDVVALSPYPPERNSAPHIPVPNVQLADLAYDSRLCGVVNEPAAPGAEGEMVTLGSFSQCKVDADISPIAIGDLLTSSPTPGHAQKVIDKSQAIGAILGKALASLAAGKGVIPVLVLQH